MPFSAPFVLTDRTETNSISHLSCYWVCPPAESRPLELGRPMAMQYNVVYETSVQDDVVPKLVKNSFFFFFVLL